VNCIGLSHGMMGRLTRPAGVFAVSLALHVTFVLLVGNERPTLWENGVIAHNLLAGKGFCMASVHPSRTAAGPLAGDAPLAPLMRTQPTSNQAPGYPFLLFTIWRLWGTGPSAWLLIRLLQAILISAMVFPVYRLTLRWFDKHAAVAAMWLVVLIPLHAKDVINIHQAAIVYGLHPWIILGWLRVADGSSRTTMVLTGLGAGLAILFQPVLLGVFGLIGLLLLIRSARNRRVAATVHLLAAGLLALMVLSPWTIRNYRVHGQLELVKNCFGKELWIGNSPMATGTLVFKGGTSDVFQAQVRSLAADWSKVALTEKDFMRFLQTEAMTYIRGDPVGFLRRTAKKVFWYWTATPRELRIRGSETDRALLYTVHTLYWTGLVFLAGLAFLAGRRPGEYLMVLVPVMLVYSATYGLTFVGQMRFRGEMEYLLVPAAAQGLILVWGWVAARLRASRGFSDA